MNLPLEIRHGDDVLQLESAGYSTTRLDLFLTLDAFGPRLMELDVRDVQALAGALLAWLAGNGHGLPDAPAGWLLLESTVDLIEDADGQPPAPPATFSSGGPAGPVIVPATFSAPGCSHG